MPGRIDRFKIRLEVRDASGYGYCEPRCIDRLVVAARGGEKKGARLFGSLGAAGTAESRRARENSEKRVATVRASAKTVSCNASSEFAEVGDSRTRTQNQPDEEAGARKMNSRGADAVVARAEEQKEKRCTRSI